ncbi:MAG TPA: hypothetical protein VKB47_09270 [Terracidiphilus sp.]|nr:hypothetical protein [Terracidiphilus sp.]
MTAAPRFQNPATVFHVGGEHPRSRSAWDADTAFSLAAADLGPWSSLTKTGLPASDLAVKRLVSLGNTRQATAGWRAAGS